MSDPSKQVGAVLLFGPPGVGKSLFASELLREHGKQISKFLNVGAELRSRGLVDEYQEHPTEEARRAAARTARELLEAACAELMAPSSAACSGPRRVQAYSFGQLLHTFDVGSSQSDRSLSLPHRASIGYK